MINKLEQVSKACVSTVVEGIDDYQMMSKDLEKKVDDVDGSYETLVKIVVEMAEDKNNLLMTASAQIVCSQFQNKSIEPQGATSSGLYASCCYPLRNTWSCV